METSAYYNKLKYKALVTIKIKILYTSNLQAFWNVTEKIKVSNRIISDIFKPIVLQTPLQFLPIFTTLLLTYTLKYLHIIFTNCYRVRGTVLYFVDHFRFVLYPVFKFVSMSILTNFCVVPWHTFNRETNV